ncbi:hypothetical protein EPUL_002970 [Erysiphe pulchra]|uniref:DNA helicase Pif1-like 2B domain-containing protein n=1 Tax=Erysiphe pulchra TaxID=225359 RepID=A0A2S4PN11_9PEZI|nr:hypothetical protein EPUL_002970 [Erysiphe pulchra]
MSEITETSYCTKYKSNWPSSFLVINRKETLSRHLASFAQRATQQTSGSRHSVTSGLNGKVSLDPTLTSLLKSDKDNSINNLLSYNFENSGSAEIDTNKNQTITESIEVQQTHLNQSEAQRQLTDPSIHDNNQKDIERIYVSGEANQRFADLLAKLSYESNLVGQLVIPEWIQSINDCNIFKELIYPRRELESGDTTIFHDRAILLSLVESIARFNSEIAQVRIAESHEYLACDLVQNDQSGQISNYAPDYLQTLEVKNLPDGKVKLYIGMPVMFLRNYYPKQGLCNGTRLIIKRLFNFCVKARIISQDLRFDGKEHTYHASP